MLSFSLSYCILISSSYLATSCPRTSSNFIRAILASSYLPSCSHFSLCLSNVVKNSWTFCSLAAYSESILLPVGPSISCNGSLAYRLLSILDSSATNSSNYIFESGFTSTAFMIAYASFLVFPRFCISSCISDIAIIPSFSLSNREKIYRRFSISSSV